VFLQDIYAVSARVTATASARVDHWHNGGGRNTETTLATGVVSDPVLRSRDDTVMSGRVGALYRASSRVSIWGDVASGFRAPTLNELYRRFSLGAMVTLANPELGPERLAGGEIGVNLLVARQMTARATWFDNRVKDPVANVTITPPNLLQRQNLGRTRIRGLQLDWELQAGRQWRFAAAYAHSDATVTENPANPALIGRSLAQVPRHRGSLQLQYTDPRIVTATLDLQASSAQFDDDLNTPARQLAAYSVVNLSVSRAFGRRLEGFVSAQNLFDTEFEVGSLPTLLGMPRMVTAGIRVRLAPR
jgi:iron complex outermembrane recepter protein